MNPPDISPELRAYIESIEAKRPKTMLVHILKYGSITTKELDELYGYKHAPRAARDVEELGIHLIRTRITQDGRGMTKYTLADDIVITGRKGGRRTFPKKFKATLLARDGEQCQLCRGTFPGNTLQIDHRVPYEVGGDLEGELQPESFMLLCGSCNRAKSWACEHCENWKAIKDPTICKTCMFASPDHYQHIAMTQKRQLTLNWAGEEVQDYDILSRQASAEGQQLAEYVKHILNSRRDP
ncbi:MAG TPA: HNH endonuclease signature motif containing protein [Ktedonobacteraceae bacterium]|nr:HNH endonuclease signature motif containing protein [Ktedonobacteraceae bacterium]